MLNFLTTENMKIFRRKIALSFIAGMALISCCVSIELKSWIAATANGVVVFLWVLFQILRYKKKQLKKELAKIKKQNDLL